MDMIAVTLEFITAQLNEFLKRRTSDNKTLVKLSGFEAPSSDAEFNYPLTLSLVNIVEEGSIANQIGLRKQGDVLSKQAPPLFLNLYILLRSNGQNDSYSEGLRWLSMAILFFQQNRFLSSDSLQMPEHIEKLSFELINLDLDVMGKFWDALETSYQPSVIYKVRMLKIDNYQIRDELPEIKNVEKSN